MNICKNCNEPINGNYCPNCGQPANPQRIDKHYIIHEIADVLFTHSGFLYTVKRIFTNPGENIKQYLAGNRSRYVKPVTFVIITTFIYTVISHFFHIGINEYSPQHPGTEFPTLNLLLNWMIDYSGYSHLIIGFFVAFWVKLFFRKSGYNLFEIFVLLCFISGVMSFCFSFVLILHGLTHLNLIQISSLFAMLYSTWAIGQFFDKRKMVSYIKAFLSYAIGIIVFAFSVAFIGVFIDVVLKQ